MHYDITHWHFETSCTDSNIIPITELSSRWILLILHIKLISKWLQLQEHHVFGSYKIKCLKTVTFHMSPSHSNWVYLKTTGWWRGQVMALGFNQISLCAMSLSCPLVLGQIIPPVPPCHISVEVHFPSPFSCSLYSRPSLYILFCSSHNSIQVCFMGMAVKKPLLAMQYSIIKNKLWP